MVNKSLCNMDGLHSTGLMDYKSRMPRSVLDELPPGYDPSLGRFIQPDTIVPGTEISQAWNRYSYVGNNPVNATDPSGQMTVADSDVDDADYDPVLVRELTVKFRLAHFKNIKISGFSISEQESLAMILEYLERIHGGYEHFSQDFGEFSIMNRQIPALGMVPPFFGRNIVLLDDSIFDQNFVHTISHELGHVFDFNSSGFYKSQIFISIFNPGCGVGGRFGCVAAYYGNNQAYSSTVFLYRNLNFPQKGNYLPSIGPPTPYGKVASIEDFADSYATYVTMGNLDPIRKFLIKLWIDQ